MTLEPGVRIGPYDVTGSLGKGGMGEVYRARDTKLDRDVALKVLPQAFTEDPDRLARFEREAKVLASLNHPNIAQIHGLEESEPSTAEGKSSGQGVMKALVLELVEGPTLADRIAQGPISVEEALPIAKQVAEALEAAHEAGVIHRDLKPANIKVKEDGTVKVLDFGLAKALDTTPAGDPSQSPTLTAAATQMGVIMGTAAYMSPEQSRGSAVDHRVDIWAFGVVLYEMLTGTRLFDGATVSDMLAAVLRADPHWDNLPADTPSAVRRLLRRCLTRERKERLQHVGDARVEIRDALSTPSQDQAEAPTQAASVRPVLPWAFASLVVGSVITALAVSSLRQPPPTSPAGHAMFTIVPPAGIVPGIPFISPDGQTVAFIGFRDVGEAEIYTRRIDRLEAEPVPGTERAGLYGFSPDGEWLLFGQQGALKRVAMQGGPATTIGEDGLYGADWGPDSTIVQGSDEGLWSIPASGGERTQLTTLRDDEAGHYGPRFLPSGRALLFTVRTGTIFETETAVYDLDTGERRVLVAGRAPMFAGSHMVFYRGGALWAAPFDVDGLEVNGTPTRVVEAVEGRTGLPRFSVGRDGTLLYVPSRVDESEPRSLVWVDRQGNEDLIPAEPRLYEGPQLSPDGRHVAVQIRDGSNGDIWIYDLARDIPTRLTFDPAIDLAPVWTPDGQRILFTSPRAGVMNVHSKAVDGTGAVERLAATENVRVAWQVVPDGTAFVFAEIVPETGQDLGMATLGGDNQVDMLVETEYLESHPSVSPDGRWLAYSSEESGQREVYVRPFPNVDDGRWQVSNGEGFAPIWSPNGRELFYQTLSAPDSPISRIMSVAFDADPTFRPSTPVPLFEGPYRLGAGGAMHSFDIAPDGQRFLMLKESTGTTASREQRIIVAQSWVQELSERVSTP